VSDLEREVRSAVLKAGHHVVRRCVVAGLVLAVALYFLEVPHAFLLLILPTWSALVAFWVHDETKESLARDCARLTVDAVRRKFRGEDLTK
jgi:hypothetical protein